MTATTARPSTTARDSLLRFAIRLDGVVVTLLGLSRWSRPRATVTGLPAAVEYGVGAFSIAYGPLAFWLAARPRVRSIGIVVAAINVGTSIALIALVAAGAVAADHRRCRTRIGRRRLHRGDRRTPVRRRPFARREGRAQG